MDHQHHHLIPTILHLLVGGVLGLAAASLALQLGWRSADRLPGESRWPHCLWCLRPFTWQESFPLFGWLLRPDILTFPCPCGIRKYQWQQPAVEIFGFLFGVASFQIVGWVPASVPMALGLGLLPAIALVDLHFGIIPDGLNILLGLFGFWWALALGDIYLGLIVAAILLGIGIFCALIYSRWRGKEMLGLGDVKFFAASGLWLHPQTAPWFLAGAGISGVIIGLLWQRGGGGKEFPFAPALCLSLSVCVLIEALMMQ